MNYYASDAHGFPIRHQNLELELPKLLKLITNFFGPTTRALLARFYHACRKFILVRLGKYAYRFLSLFLSHHQQSELMDRHTIRYPDLRKSLFHPFAQMDLILHSKNHSHADSAILRSSTTAKIESVVATAGYRPYSLSPSPREAYDGARCYYSPKDLAVPFKFDAISDEHVIMCVDTDIYADMNQLLKLGKPILIYTFVPTTVAGRNPEQSWYIKDNKIHFFVKGGSEYQHEIWDYNGDTISIVADDLTLIVYSIEQKQFDKDLNRRIIALLPKSRTKYPYYLPLKFKDGITRLKYKHGDVNVIYDSINDNLSIGMDADQFSVELKGKTFYAIEKRLANKTSAPLAIDIERMLDDEILNKPETASILIELIKTKFTRNHFTTAVVATNYQSLIGSPIDDGNSNEVQLMDALLINPAIYPKRSYNNDLAMIAGRIERPRNVKEPPKLYVDHAKEFSRILINGNEHKLYPITIAQVNEIQSKPTQRARTELVKDIMSEHFRVKLKPFQKAEGYASANDPRNITSLNAEATLVFSSFTYPFKWAILKQCPWYSPGMTPKQIETRLCSMTGDLIATDFSRFDGSISKWLQNRVIRTNYHVAFKEQHDKSLLYKKFNEMHFAKAKSMFGVNFDPGYGTKSGSPFTTDGNTMVNAFIGYSALRQLGYEDYAAWASLGLYCGDDGLIVNVPGLQAMLLKVCQDLGLTIECVLVRADSAVPFCGRYFVRADLECYSFSDPLRTLGKFHLSSNKMVTPQQALVNKALGYAATDNATPVLSALLDRIFQLYGHEEFRMLPEEEFRMNNSWTQIDRETILPWFLKISGLTRELVDLLEDEIINSDLKTINNKIPNEVKHKIPAIVGENIVGTVPKQRIQNTNKRKQLKSMSDNNITIEHVAKSNRTDDVGCESTKNAERSSGCDNEGLPEKVGRKGESSNKSRGDRRGLQPKRPNRPYAAHATTGGGSDADIPPTTTKPNNNNKNHRNKPKQRNATDGQSRAIAIMEAAGIDWKKEFTMNSRL
nr:MAG: RNA-dependent RNA polymerase [Wufeng shrew nodavirus 3]